MMIRQAARDGATAVPLAGALRDAIMRLNRRLRQARPVGDLTMSQISALTTLGFAGVLSPRELAEQERVQPPTMTKIVAKLEQRTPHPTDGRQVVLSATETGRAAVVEHRRAGDAWLAEAIGELPVEDRETLQRAAELLNKIARI
jgi:DNA-binding MarR family transcriptional regulator